MSTAIAKLKFSRAGSVVGRALSSAVDHTASGTGAVTTTLSRLLETTFSPQMFGAVAGIAASNHDALQKALAAAGAAATTYGGAEVHIDRPYAISQGLVIPNGVKIVGKSGWGEAGLIAIGSGSFNCLSAGAGAYTGSPIAVTANSAFGAVTIQVNSLTNGAVTLAAGDFIQIRHPLPAVGAAILQGQLNRIKLISGAGPYTITVENPLEFDLTATNGPTLVKVEMTNGIGIADLWLSGASASGIVSGVNITGGAKRFTVDNVRTEFFTGANAYGQAYANIWTDAFMRGLHDDSSGNVTGSGNAMAFFWLAGEVHDIIVQDCAGPGIGFDFCSGARAIGVTSRVNVNTVRALKLEDTCGMQLHGVSIAGGTTGIGFARASQRNIVHGLTARGVVDAVWSNGEANTDNVIIGANFASNTRDLSIAVGDTGFVIRGVGGWSNSDVLASAFGAGTSPSVDLTATLTPAQLTAGVNDYNPSGLSTAHVLRLSSSAAVTITGLAGGWGSREIEIHNVGTQNITINDEDAASVAANRFDLNAASLTISSGLAIVLRYDATSARWRRVA